MRRVLGQWPGCLPSSLLAAVLMLVLSQSGLAQIDQRENERLETWLAQQGLDGLLLEQLESRLESTLDRRSREELAKRLAAIYSQRLLSLEGDSRKWLKRTRELISLYPRFESGRLRVAMLHARYLEAEKSFRDWMRSGAGEGGKKELESTLSVLDADLSGALAALQQQSEDLFAAGQLRGDRRAVETRRQTVEAEALHCQFLAGWSSYFLAMMRRADRTALLQQAERRFREFLQLDQQTRLSDYDSRWFDFSSAWHVRAIVGLSAIAVADGETSRARHLYGLIRNHAVSRESREAVMRFRLLAHAYSRQFEQASNVLRDRKAIAAMSRQGRVRLWATAIEILQASRSAELKQMTYAGLTRNMAGELLVRELAKSEPQPEGNSFEALWVAGYAEFWKAENGAAASGQKADELLSKAVKLGATAGGDADDVARCRYLLAWRMLQRKKAGSSDGSDESEKAVDIFTQVAAQLADSDPQLASESAWLAARTSVRLGGNSPGKLNEAWNRLERFVRTWPDSPYAAKASFEKLKIELRSMPAENAIRKLREISSADENYGESLVEAAAQHYRLWQSQPNEASLGNLREACSEADSSPATTEGQKVRANFLMMNALLRTQPADETGFQVLVQRCQRLLQGQDDRDDAKAELRYYQMQQASQQGDPGDKKRAFAFASEVLELGTGTRFELPALIQIARYHDSILGSDDSDSQRLAAALAAYGQLSQKLGTHPEQLRSSPNARVALVRLGELHQMSNQSRQSEAIFQSLVELFPGNAKYLRGLAFAKTGRDNVAARELWQRISSGSEAGSDLWFESKLELARLAANSDSDLALRLLRQTRQLGGEMSPHWQKRYQEEIERIGHSEVSHVP